MITSEKIDQIAAALAKFQSNVKSPKKSKKVNVKSERGQYSYLYSPLEDIISDIKEPMEKQGLSFFQSVGSTTGGITAPFVITRLLHTSGQWIESDALVVPAANNKAQEIGSAITYARRYQLSGVLGIAADEDDDASGADNAPVSSITPTRPAVQQPKAPAPAARASKPVPKPTPNPTPAPPPAASPDSELEAAMEYAPFTQGDYDGKPMKSFSKEQLDKIVATATLREKTRQSARLVREHLYGTNGAAEQDEPLAEEPPDAYMGFKAAGKQ